MSMSYYIYVSAILLTFRVSLAYYLSSAEEQFGDFPPFDFQVYPNRWMNEEDERRVPIFERFSSSEENIPAEEKEFYFVEMNAAPLTPLIRMRRDAEPLNPAQIYVLQRQAAERAAAVAATQRDANTYSAQNFFENIDRRAAAVQQLHTEISDDVASSEETANNAADRKELFSRAQHIG